MSHSAKRLFVAILVWQCAMSAFAADPPAAAATPSAHPDVGTTVEFELERPRIPTPLPFDVQFFLKAKVPGTTKKEAKASYAEAVSGQTCTPSTTLAAVVAGAETDRYLEVTVDPPLEAQRRYCFRFETLRDRTEEEAKKMVPAIAASLTQVYADANFLDVARNLNSLREDLYRAVAASVAPNAIVLPPNSFLKRPADARRPATMAAQQTWNNDVASAPPFPMKILLARPIDLREQARDAIGNYQGRMDDVRGVDRPQLQETAKLSEIRTEIEELVEARKALPKKTAAEKENLSVLDLGIENLRIAAERLEEQEGSILEMAKAIEVELSQQYDIAATTNAGFVTRFSWYVSADLGMGVAPETEDFFSYLGANIYLRPINKNAPLSGLDFRKRFAIMLGFSEKLTGADREGLISDRPVLLGGGIRVTDHFRIALGAQLFREDDPDPLITKKSLAATPFISASIDVDVADVFQSLFKPLFN
ncbi:MAG TPA: hypothetical protein VF432_16295 [Thermoanaerobaculia bacterium]